MTRSSLLLVALAAATLWLSACGPGRLALVLVFPDDVTRDAARSVVLYAVPGEQGATCAELLTGLRSPEELAEHAETFEYPPTSDLTFPRLAFGVWVFVAQVRDDGGTLIADGCIEEMLSRQSGGELELPLVGMIVGPDSGIDAMPDVAVPDSMPADGGTDTGTADSGTDMGIDSGTDAGPPPACGTTPGILDFCWHGGSAPTINGTINTVGEWVLAGTCTDTFASGGVVTFYGLAGGANVFLAAAVSDDTVDGADRTVLLVDVNDNLGDPDTADRLFRVTRMDTGEVANGIGTNSDGLDFMLVATSLDYSMTSNANAWAVEMRVPKAQIGSPAAGTTVHLAVGVRDIDTGDLASCPIGVIDIDLSTWGYSLVE